MRGACSIPSQSVWEDILARLQETVSQVKKQATVVSLEGTGRGF